jgi:hypothetical protein
MKRMAQALVLTVAGLLLLAAPGRVAAAAVDVSIGFDESLAPYGDWLDHARFGRVWAPRNVERGWRPYMHGRWEYTDYDWTWVSDEEWGWATDHYGRWFLDPDEGWLWIPGDEWAPAWVAWRDGGGYVGWAPLPPEVDAFEVDAEFDVDPFAFSFVEERYLCEPAIFRHFVPVARNGTYVRLTRSATRYGRVDGRIVNRGIDIGRIERSSGRLVPRVAIRDVGSLGEIRGGRGVHGGLAIFRPRVVTHDVERREEGGSLGLRIERRPRDVVRSQDQERRRFESDERRERGRLLRVQRSEERRPSRILGLELDATSGRGEGSARDESAVERHPSGVKRSLPDAVREQIRARHEGELKAQGEHEQRERRVLERRHERERSTKTDDSEKRSEEKHQRKR